MTHYFLAGRCARFLLGFFVVSTALASDVSFYGIVKERTFVQNTNTGPAAVVSGGFGFQCFIDSSEPNVINSAQLTPPSGPSRALSPDGPDSFFFGEQFDSASAMNAVYGTGTYNLGIQSENDIISFAQMDMPADAYPAAPPFITNYDEAQNIDPEGSFGLVWSGFTNGTAGDFIQVQIQDTNGNPVFASSGPPGAPGALNGIHTSIVIPAGALAPGREYNGEIFFAKIVVSNTADIPGARGILAFAARTSFKLRTSSPVQEAINLYGVFKAQNFMQTNDAPPVLSTNEAPFQFNSFVDVSATNEVLYADLRLRHASRIGLNLWRRHLHDEVFTKQLRYQHRAVESAR
jgi:hypothetical protein